MEALLLNAPGCSIPFARKRFLSSNKPSILIDNRNRNVRLPKPRAASTSLKKTPGDSPVASPLPPRKRVSADSLQFPPGYLISASDEGEDSDSLIGQKYATSTLSSKVYDVTVESPLHLAPKLSRRLGVNIWLKREDLQRGCSFKLRGAYNMMAKLSKEQLERGVICSSTGNHAQGVALAAKQLKCEAVIVMPVTTPEFKWQPVKELGAAVVFVGDSYDEAETHAKKRSEEEGRIFIPPFDHPDVIIGQGTIGMEIVNQMKGIGNTLHAIFVPIGGGGLIAGIAAYVKSVCPEVKVIGVEASDANAMALSLCHGERVILDKVEGFSVVKEVGEETFRLCKQLIDGVVLVSHDAIWSSIEGMVEEARNILEPAGALSVAGAEAYYKYYELKGENVVAIISGANVNFEEELGIAATEQIANNVGREQQAVLTTIIPEKPGSFKRFCELVGPMNITEIKYRYGHDLKEKAVVLYSVGKHMPSELEEMKKRMKSSQFETYDFTNNNLVTDHYRNVMRGDSNVEDEIVCHYNFPKRLSGSDVEKLLDAFSPRWNISLFDYDGQGESENGANIVVRFQIDKSEMGEFCERARKIGFRV